MAKVLCVLYPDPESGYPPDYPRDDIPKITTYANGQTAPTPKGPLGFTPGKLVERDAVVGALESGRIAGYAGGVWYPQPAPADHPWRTMPFNGMTPHISGTSLSAQARYAARTLEILESYFEESPIREEYLIVDSGGLAGTGASSYKLS